MERAPPASPTLLGRRGGQTPRHLLLLSVSQYSVVLSHRALDSRSSIDLVRPARRSAGSIIVEGTPLRSALPTVANRATEQQPESPAPESENQEQPSAELRRLMDLADRYARQLVSAADAPPRVLLLVHGSDLDVVTLDGLYSDVRALPRLLARSRPSSAVLVAADEGVSGHMDGHVVFVVGETSDGQREERRFRVRACGRTRRLTRLIDDDAGETPPTTPRLFPPPAMPMA